MASCPVGGLWSPPGVRVRTLKWSKLRRLATSNVPFFILAWRKTITPRPAGSLSYPATIPAMNHVPKSCTPRSAQKLPQLPGNCNGHGAGQLKYIIKKTHFGPKLRASSIVDGLLFEKLFRLPPTLLVFEFMIIIMIIFVLALLLLSLLLLLLLLLL